MSVNVTYLVIKVFLRGKTALILDSQESVLRLGIWMKMQFYQRIVLGQLDIQLQMMAFNSSLHKQKLTKNGSATTVWVQIIKLIEENTGMSS